MASTVVSNVASAGVLASLALVLACGDASTPAPPADDIVATYDGGQVSRDDLDRRILRLPRETRNEVLADTDGPASLVRQEVVERLLLDAARDESFEAGSDVALRIAEAYRGTLAERCLSAHGPTATPPDDAAMRAYFDANEAQYHRPARRMVFHLFLRRGADEAPADVRARATALRERMLAGESFLDLARTHSDSASRHQGGALGWLEAGTLPPDLERVVFDLEPHQPSVPIATRDGHHLFLVDTTLAAKTFSFEEMRPTIWRRLQREAQAVAVQTMTEGFVWPDDVFVATEDELAELLEAGDETVLYRNGDYTVTVATFRERVARAASDPGAESDPRRLALDTYDTLTLRERLFLYCRDTGIADEAAAQTASDREADRARIERERERRMTAWVEAHPEVVQRYFERNRTRYAHTPRLRLRLATVPRGDDPVATMGRLEAAHAQGDLAAVEALTRELGGRVEPLGWQTVRSLQLRFPAAASRSTSLDHGEVSAPFEVGNGLGLLLIDERRATEPRDLEEVREDVVADYIRHHAAEVYSSVEAALLDEVGFTLWPERLGAAIGSATGLSSTAQGTEGTEPAR